VPLLVFHIDSFVRLVLVLESIQHQTEPTTGDFATMPDMVRDSRDIEMASDERYDKLLMEEVEWQKSSGLTKECKAPSG